MATTFGPTFGDEVIAAGLGGLPFAWSPDGTLTGAENLTAAQQTTLNAVIAAHNPAKQPVPQRVTAAQARIALNAAGKRTAVETAVTAATANVQDYWHYSPYIDRHHPVLLQMQQTLAWADADMDALFTAAAAAA